MLGVPHREGALAVAAEESVPNEEQRPDQDLCVFNCLLLVRLDMQRAGA